MLYFLSFLLICIDRVVLQRSEIDLSEEYMLEQREKLREMRGC